MYLFILHKQYMKYTKVLFSFLSNLQLRKFDYLKTIVLADVLPILNSNHPKQLSSGKQITLVGGY